MSLHSLPGVCCSHTQFGNIWRLNQTIRSSAWEGSGSVVECLTPDWGAVSWSLTGDTALCPWARLINTSLVLVQPRKTCPYITERLLMGRKESNQTKQKEDCQPHKVDRCTSMLYGKCSKISNTLLFFLLNRIVVISAGINQIIVRSTNKQVRPWSDFRSSLILVCTVSMSSWQATSVQTYQNKIYLG